MKSSARGRGCKWAYWQRVQRGGRFHGRMENCNVQVCDYASKCVRARACRCGAGARARCAWDALVTGEQMKERM